MKKFLLALILIALSSPAWAQCSGVFANNTVCGNATGSNNTPRATAITAFPGLFANPTAQVGLSTINGTAITAMRSDAAPSLDQSISPTMLGTWAFSNVVTAPTQALNDNSTKVATTAYVQAALGGAGGGTPQARCSLTSNTPITTADVSGATSIYYVPVNGNIIQIYDGAAFIGFALSAQLTLALDSNSGHTGYQQSGKIYDLFVINDSGTRRFGTGPAWTSDTSRGTGAGTTEISTISGIWTNTNAVTLRYGSSSGDTVSTPVGQGTYVCSFRATADGQATDSVLLRLLYNNYQQVTRQGLVQEAGVSWNYSLAAYRQVNASAANQIAVLFGLSGTLVQAQAFNVVSNSSSTARTVGSGIGVDSCTVNNGRSTLTQALDTPIATVESFYNGFPGIGYHYLCWEEYGNGTDTQTWYGNNSGTSVHRAGMSLVATQ